MQQYNDHNQKIEYGFDGLDNNQLPDDQEQEEQDQPEQPEQNFTKEQEITDDKTTVKTVINMKGDDLVNSYEPLSEEIAATMIPKRTEDVSIFSCYQCNLTKVKLLPIITEEQKRAYCCMRCMTFEALDIHFEEFLNNSEAYTGTFHNYLDKVKS